MKIFLFIYLYLFFMNSPTGQTRRRIFTLDGRHLEKSQKLLYLRNGLADLYEIWYADAKWVS